MCTVMYLCVRGIVMYLCVRGIVMYLCVKGIVMYLCVRLSILPLSTIFAIEFWNYSDSVIFVIFHIIIPLQLR